MLNKREQKLLKMIELKCLEMKELMLSQGSDAEFVALRICMFEQMLLKKEGLRSVFGRRSLSVDKDTINPAERETVQHDKSKKNKKRSCSPLAEDEKHKRGTERNSPDNRTVTKNAKSSHRSKRRKHSKKSSKRSRNSSSPMPKSSREPRPPSGSVERDRSPSPSSVKNRQSTASPAHSMKSTRSKASRKSNNSSRHDIVDRSRSPSPHREHRSYSRSPVTKRSRSASRSSSYRKRHKSRSSSGGGWSHRSRSSHSRSLSRSRSPSIRRRRGSPSHLDRRRITSARKRPIPYYRPSPASSSSLSWSPRSLSPLLRYGSLTPPLLPYRRRRPSPFGRLT